MLSGRLLYAVGRLPRYSGRREQQAAVLRHVLRGDKPKASGRIWRGYLLATEALSTAA